MLATRDSTARLHRVLEGLYCYADVRTDEPQTQLAKALAAEVVQLVWTDTRSVETLQRTSL